MRILFLCSRNRLRSPTAEQAFSQEPGLEVCSAGLSPDAEHRLAADLVEWAEIIFVMEECHRAKLSRTFGKHLRGKRVICLGIPDEYDYMDPELVELLRERVGRSLPR